MRPSWTTIGLALFLMTAHAAGQVLIIPEGRPTAPNQPDQPTRPAQPPSGPTPMTEMRSPDEAPPVPVIDPLTPNMSFRLIEGQGVFGLSRWVQASGLFVGSTGADFEAFLRANPRAAGLTVALDSGGGNLGAGLQLGRLFRQNRMNTIVGKTVTRTEQGRTVNTLVTHFVTCASACTYAFMGGVVRRVGMTSRIGVHQFSQSLDAMGRPVDPGFGMAEFVSAQALTSALAVFVAEMGIDLRFLELASSRPFGQPLLFLSNGDIQRTRFATPTDIVQSQRRPVGWSLDSRSDAPTLYRMVSRTEPSGRRVDEELSIFCLTQEANILVHYRRTLATLPPGGSPVQVGAIRFSTDGRPDTTFQRNAGELPPVTSRVNDNQLLALLLAIALVESAAQTNSLRIQVAPTRDGTFQPPTNWGDGFGDAFRNFVAICAPALEARAAAARPQTQRQPPPAR